MLAENLFFFSRFLLGNVYTPKIRIRNSMKLCILKQNVSKYWKGRSKIFSNKNLKFPRRGNFKFPILGSARQS